MTLSEGYSLLAQSTRIVDIVNHLEMFQTPGLEPKTSRYEEQLYTSSLSQRGTASTPIAGSGESQEADIAWGDRRR